jgi:hypothetical protein
MRAWQSARAKWTADSKQSVVAPDAPDFSVLSESDRALLKADLSGALRKDIADAHGLISARV